MSSRAEFAAVIAALKTNPKFGDYVATLEAQYNTTVDQLLDSDHPDEALRGECRAVRTMLRNINKALGDLK